MKNLLEFGLPVPPRTSLLRQRLDKGLFKRAALRVMVSGFKSWPRHLLPMRPLADFSTFLCLNFLICEMGMEIILLTLGS